MAERTQLHTGMEDRSCQFNMTKMARTLRHAFSTCLALEVAVDSAHTGIHQSAHLRLMCSFVHDFWMFDFGDRDGFLWHCQFSVLKLLQNTYNFLRRENTKLYFLNFANWSRGKSELMTEHGELRIDSSRE